MGHEVVPFRTLHTSVHGSPGILLWQSALNWSDLSRRNDPVRRTPLLLLPGLLLMFIAAALWRAEADVPVADAGGTQAFEVWLVDQTDNDR